MRCGRARGSCPCTGRRSSHAPAPSTPPSIRRSTRSPASPSSSTPRSKFAACRLSGMARFSPRRRWCRDPRRHQLRLLPSRDPRAAARRAAEAGGLMQSFPLFLTLLDRHVLVVGGTEAAARKVELLLSAGARVTLIADTVTGEIAQLIAEGVLSWAGRGFDDTDLAGMSLVIVASDDEALQVRVSLAAQRRCIPVNVVDRPRLSSCIMPAIVDRAPITIAISTGGAAPALARRLRAEIERAMPAAPGPA